MCTSALTSVAQWIERWPVDQKAASWIPSQDACLGCRPGPQLGACERQLINLSHTSMFPSLPPSFLLSKNKQIKSFKKMYISQCKFKERYKTVPEISWPLLIPVAKALQEFDLALRGKKKRKKFIKDTKKKGEMTVSGFPFGVGSLPSGVGRGCLVCPILTRHPLSRQKKGPSLKSSRHRCLLSGWPRGIAEPSEPGQCLRRSQREALVGIWGAPRSWQEGSV